MATNRLNTNALFTDAGFVVVFRATWRTLNTPTMFASERELRHLDAA